MEVEELLCAVLRGENPAWPKAGDDRFAARLIERSAYHGVQALVDHRLRHRGADGGLGWPKAVLEACRNQAVAQATRELRHRWLLACVIERLSQMGVRPLVFKGTASAYDLYPAPFLRTRADTDLLVPPDTRNPAIQALETLGFARLPNVSGDFITYEAGFDWLDPAAKQTHSVDLHWRINNSELLSHLFSYQELYSKARRLPPLDAEAIAVSRVDALLLACMHWAVHKRAPYYVDNEPYRGGDRLIWFYDIHLLLGALSVSEHQEFVELAERKGLRRTCWESVERARALFGSEVPEAVFRSLAQSGSLASADRYLNASGSCRFWADFRAIPGVRNKLRFLAEFYFPPESYMRWKYRGTKPACLPWLYLRRAGEGAWKSFLTRAM